jgi:5'-3' exonuclease
MYILDYNAVAIANLHAELGRNPGELSFDFLRHLILNSIRCYVREHKHAYGQLIIASDSKSWRKKVFPHYKGKRAVEKQKSRINWDQIYPFVNQVFDEISTHFPYICIKVDGAEADDIIGACVTWYHENTDEDILILSGDKDFKQLHYSSRVRQFSPVQKRYIGVSDREKEKLELILCGDRGDGVPNILSADETFMIDGIKQKKMTQGRLEKYMSIDLEDPDENDQYRNWKRNQKLIDLDFTPESIRDEILNTLTEQLSQPRKSNVFNYLFNQQLKMLLENVSDF